MNFSELGLCDELSQAVADLGYTAPTPIQEKSIPYVLMGRDILGSAQTGTGKTASFTLPMIEILASGRAKARLPRSLILAPTRELAAQVADSFEKFSTYHKLSMALLIGGVSFADQNAALSKGVDVLIATPGRLLDHFERGKVLLTDVKVLVIDEADRMLDMGFMPDVRRIVRACPRRESRQTLLFSATFTPQIVELSDRWTFEPVRIEIEPEHVTTETVEQIVYITTADTKYQLLKNVIHTRDLHKVMVFANRRDLCRDLVDRLTKDGIDASLLSGEVPQRKRIQTLDRFKEGKTRILVATDVAGRGIHIDGVGHVINYTLPEDAEDYVHRIGRTGRAGAEGTSISFACEDDSFLLPEIEDFIGRKLPCEQAPESLLEGSHGESVA